MYELEHRKTIQDEVCRKIAQGKSILTISNEKNMPHEETLYAWLKKYADFSKNYTQARLDQAQHFANEIMDIGDDLTKSKFTTREQIEVAKVRIDSRKWIASKLLPKKYGPPAAQTNIQINTQPITGMKIIDIEHEEIEEID